MFGDYFELNILIPLDDLEKLPKIMELFPGVPPKVFACHVEKETLQFLSGPYHQSHTPLSFPVRVVALAPLVVEWLQSATFPPRPSNDGSIKKALRIKAGKNHPLVVSFSAEWVIYGK